MNGHYTYVWQLLKVLSEDNSCANYPTSTHRQGAHEG